MNASAPKAEFVLTSRLSDGCEVLDEGVDAVTDRVVVALPEGVAVGELGIAVGVTTGVGAAPTSDPLQPASASATDPVMTQRLAPMG